MSWLKTIIGLATVGLATAAVLSKVNEDKKKQQELDEFLCPESDEPIVVAPTKELPYEKVEKDVLELEKLDVVYVTCYYGFEFEESEQAVAFQEECSDSGLSTSMVKNVVDVMYSGDTKYDELNEFFMKLYPILDEMKPKYQGCHFEG